MVAWPAFTGPGPSAGRDIDPSAELRAAGTVHHSPALEELLGCVGGERGCRVLDLGPAARRNLEHYSTFATRIRFADLLGGGARRELSALDGSGLGRRLDQLLPLGDSGYDLILSWDMLNYLSAEQAPAVARHLAAAASRGARLHALIVTGPTLSAEPMRYQIVGPGQVAYCPTSTDTVPAPDLPPALVERRLRPFVVARSVVLRHGVRELVAVLD